MMASSRTTLRGTFAAGFALMLASATVRAQGPPGGPPGPGGPGGPGGAALVLSPSVQKDLELTDKQLAQVKKLEASMNQKRRELFGAGGPPGGNPDPRQAMASLQRELEAAVTRMLTKRQKDRLAQIDLQREGVIAVARKEVATKVKLTSAQNKKVRAIVDQMRQSIARAMPRPPGGGPGGPGGPGGGLGDGGGGFPGAGGGPGGGDGGFPNAGGGPGGGDGFPGGANPQGGDPGAAGGGRGRGGRGGGGTPPGGGPPGGQPDFNNPEFRAQMTKAREEADKLRADAATKIDEVLTPDQKAAFEKLKGEPFDLSTLRPAPGGPPPDGNSEDSATNTNTTRNNGPATAKTKSRRGGTR